VADAAEHRKQVASLRDRCSELEAALTKEKHARSAAQSRERQLQEQAWSDCLST
jgi:hypothetical protein